MSELKQQLYLLCQKYVTQRVEMLKATVAETQEAANEESKSSAGDKYETGREMLQQEIDLKVTQINEMQKLQLLLDQVNPNVKSDKAVVGSLVKTNMGDYFISISAGQLKYNNHTYYAISAASPIGAQLIGMGAGMTFLLNGKDYLITEVA